MNESMSCRPEGVVGGETLQQIGAVESFKNIYGGRVARRFSHVIPVDLGRNQ